MLQYTYLSNGDTQITCGTSDELLKELASQFSNEMTYVPYTFVSRSMTNHTTRLNVHHKSSNVQMLNPACDVFEVSPITRKLISRDAESFFACLTKQFEEGFEYSEGSANLTYGSYSSVVTKCTAQVSLNTPVPPVPLFDLSVALCLQSKDELVAYCEQFGVKIDARKSLPKIRNWLQAQSNLQGN